MLKRGYALAAACLAAAVAVTAFTPNGKFARPVFDGFIGMQLDMCIPQYIMNVRGIWQSIVCIAFCANSSMSCAVCSVLCSRELLGCN